MDGAPRPLRRARKRRILVVGALAAVVVLGGGAWALAGDVPFLTNPFRVAQVPPYLQQGDPEVEAARRGAASPLAVLGRIRDQMRDALPAAGKLWTAGARYGSDAENVELWIADHAIQFRSFEAFEVPDDPAWSEDPFSSAGWSADYQALTWLRAPLGAFELTGDRRYLAETGRYLLDWIGASNAEPAPSARTWFDDAVSIRPNVIVSMLQRDLWDQLGDDELAIVLGSLKQHGDLLEGYLRDPQFEGHNHNLFHALALHNLATALPELRGAGRWRQIARTRISTLMSELVDEDEGASMEGAAWYHATVLDTYLDAEGYLQGHAAGLSAAERENLDAMTGFGALLHTPAGNLAALGDSPYGASAMDVLEDAANLGITSDFAAFVRSRGVDGIRPPDAAFFPRSGYAIIRPTYSAGEAWRDDLQVIVDLSNDLATHGHADALSPILSAAGSPFLIDSGGPYVYQDADHGDFTGPAAHNTVIDVGRTGGRRRVTSLILEDAGTHVVVAGTQALSAGSTGWRAIVVIKPELVIVIDRVRAGDGQLHQFELLYHLPPEALAPVSTSGHIEVLGARLAFAIAGGAPLSASIVRGQEGPLVGWVTPDFGLKVEAPVLSFGQPGPDAWFVSAFQPVRAGGADVPVITATDDGAGNLSIDVEGADVGATILIDAADQIVVQPR